MILFLDGKNYFKDMINLNINAIGRRGNGFSTAALSLFNRMKDLDEEPDYDQKTALNNFISRLVNAGIWDKSDLYYKLDGHASASSLLNIIKDSSNATLAGGTIPVFTQYEGVKGNGVGYANTNFNPATQGVNFKKTGLSFGAYFYSLVGFNSPSMGAKIDNMLAVYAKDSSSKIRGGMSDGTTITSTSYLVTEGLIVIGTDSNDVVIYLNGKEFYRVTDAYGDFDSLVQYLFAFNNDGSNANETTNGKSDVIYAGELTAAQHLELYDAIIEYQEGKSGNTFFDTTFMDGIPSGNPLDKICTVGDSLTANFVGGNIPAEYDEGDGYRPMRLTVNNIARRIYDKVCTNKATHIRLDKSEWTKSGVWTDIMDTTVFEPVYSNEKYYESTESGAYVEIVVPDGQENFAFICQRDAGYDTLTVTINGGDISSYGNSTVDCDRTKDDANDIGNPYHTEEYVELPPGANTIRISKGANTNKARIWGGFYWSGATIIVHNTAHGGHRLATLYSQHLNAEVVENGFEAIVFQITLVNELTAGISYNTTIGNFIQCVTLLDGLDVLWTTCQPLGTSPITGLNSYASYNDPNEIDLSNYFKFHCWRNEYPFNDIFNQFKGIVESSGGTVPDGDAGIYTTDGVHPNELGVSQWFSLIEGYFE